MQCRCNWHHTFPAGLAPKAVPRNVATVAPPSQSTSARLDGKCSQAIPACKKNAHSSCENDCCRICCVIKGGCRVKDHSKSSMTDSQLAKIKKFRHLEPTVSTHTHSPPTLTIFETSDLWTTTWGTVASQYDEDNPTMQFLRKDNLRLEEERKSKETQGGAGTPRGRGVSGCAFSVSSLLHTFGPLKQCQSRW